MPKQTDEGRAKLRGLTSPLLFYVEYSITLHTWLAHVRSGFPPVERLSAAVNYVRSIDGKAIPPGQYLLERPTEIDRLAHLSGWHLLSWPV